LNCTLSFTAISFQIIKKTIQQRMKETKQIHFGFKRGF